ncbi:MAG: NAD(P)/FAD-dependent oxidoreductase [Phycisphaerales bacterium]|nr:NAD(P)/FAD-dependent oxidoreductase [Hyphomonadaceae bacterium]
MSAEPIAIIGAGPAGLIAGNLLREQGALPSEPHALAALIKAAPVTLTAPRGLDRAISSAGGVAWSAVDENLQLRAIPGVYVAGEMLDWEAPTGGYLLQACFATGAWAARAMLASCSPEQRPPLPHPGAAAS